MEVRPGYKQTEVGVIPLEWDALQISDVCRLVNGRGFKPHEWRTVGLPIIRIQNLNGSDDFNYYAGQYNPKILVEKGQLLFAWSGSRGTSFGPFVWNGGRALLNYHTWKVVVNESNGTPEFLLHALRQLTSYIEDRAHGASALVHMQKWEMEKFLIVMPTSLPEQRAIATALSDVDALLDRLDRLIVKKRDLKQAAMQQLLTGQTRLPGFHGEWEVKRLGQIAKLYQPETISQSEFTDSGYPVFGANGVVGMYERFNHESPQITISCRGNCGTVNRTQGPAWITGNAMVVNLDGATDIDKTFVYYALVYADLSLLVTGSGIPQIVRGPLEAFAIALPSDSAEQTAIAAVLSDMDTELAALEARRDKTRDLKQAMMQELLTGKTRLVPVRHAEGLRSEEVQLT